MKSKICQTHSGIAVCWPHHITTGKPGLRLFTDEWIPLPEFSSDKTVPCIFLPKRNGTA
ncbi:hypothetical protein PM8797T_29857 [Gimesia maris DSM 8797]|nr:hypothetical protein PM8797T_29857 [Gimesia maris DSM 8797]